MHGHGEQDISLLIIKSLGLWVLEKASELALGAIICVIFLGRNSEDNSISYIDVYKQDLGIVAIFMLYSGYIITSFIFSIFRPNLKPLQRILIQIIIFLLHCVVFLVAVRSEDFVKSLQVVVMGCVVVGFLATISSRIIGLRAS